MRKITAGLFITLDGVVEAPEKWNPPYYDDELGQAVMPQLMDADLHLYGRRSYELFQAVFTGPAAPPHAELMTGTPKVVVSTTLDQPSWGPTTLISGNVVAELSRLRQQPGGNVQVAASGSLVRLLLQEGLLDELRLLMHPIVVRHRPAPVRGRPHGGATQSARMPSAPQRCHRPALCPGRLIRDRVARRARGEPVTARGGQVRRRGPGEGARRRRRPEADLADAAPRRRAWRPGPRASPDAGQAAPQASRCTGHRAAPGPTRCAAPGWVATARQSPKRHALMNGLSQPTCENVDLAVN